MNPVIIKNVSKTYQLDKVGVQALTDINLEIHANKFTVLRGPSGSGKTTLLNLIGCLDRPSQGEIWVAGRAVHQLKDDELSDFRASHIGFIFQSFNLIATLTAYENVEYPLRLTKVAAAQRRQKVLELLKQVGLADKADRKPGELSGGQRQRVAIARALASSPALVLADEPTANLDSHTGQTIIDLMRRMQAELGVSFVFSSHDPQVLSAADDVVKIHDGRIENLDRQPG
jgi:putative ABC transport system ATP-binding protein